MQPLEAAPELTKDDADASQDSKNEFQTDQVLTTTGGHFVHDTYTGFLPPLLDVLKERLNTSYAMAGLLAVFVQLPSLLNPLIGYLADRVSVRYFVIFAPAMTGTLISCLGIPSTYVSLAILLFAAGISTAAFHAPAPAMIAQVSGSRVGTGMSLFMAAGELGRTLGPIIIAASIAWFGLEGSWRLMFIAWVVSGILFFRLREVKAPVAKRGFLPWEKARDVFPILAWIMSSRSLMLVGITTFLPLYLSDVAGASLWLAAISLTVLEGAGVIGALFSGTVSDRLGRARVLGFLLALAPVLLIAFVFAPSALRVPVLILLGLIAISPTPVLLAIVQDEFPDNRALANGTFMGLNFLIRSLAIWLIGLMADSFGLTTAFLLSGGLAFLSLPAVLLLPKPDRRIR